MIIKNRHRIYTCNAWKKEQIKILTGRQFRYTTSHSRIESVWIRCVCRPTFSREQRTAGDSNRPDADLLRRVVNLDCFSKNDKAKPISGLVYQNPKTVDLAGCSCALLQYLSNKQKMQEYNDWYLGLSTVTGRLSSSSPCTTLKEHVASPISKTCLTETDHRGQVNPDKASLSKELSGTNSSYLHW